MFILNGEGDEIGVAYPNGLFPKIPNYHKSDTWFLLTEGITDDIIVDERATVKEIRKGQYKRLVEISRNTLAISHTFNSSCRETSYTFTVTIKANVYVNDPIKFHANVKNISVRDFLNNQFSLDVKAVTREYSILNYNGIDEDLTQVLTAMPVYNDTSGLSYQVTSVMTEPNAEAMKILKGRDDMAIKHEMSSVASAIAQQNRTKNYADAIWEQAAKGEITDVEAIRRVEEYERQGREEKYLMLLRLRDEGIIGDVDVQAQASDLMPNMKPAAVKALETKKTSSVAQLFMSEEEKEEEEASCVT
jgi:hypothetical protein